MECLSHLSVQFSKKDQARKIVLLKTTFTQNMLNLILKQTSTVTSIIMETEKHQRKEDVLKV